MAELMPDFHEMTHDLPKCCKWVPTRVFYFVVQAQVISGNHPPEGDTTNFFMSQRKVGIAKLSGLESGRGISEGAPPTPPFQLI
jgi:hypothetical protein